MPQIHRNYLSLRPNSTISLNSAISTRSAISAFAIGLAFLATPTLAAPNGLTQIPLAKVFGDGVAAFSVARTAQQSQTTTYTTQYGINDRFEIDWDYQAAPSDQRTALGNLKYLLAHSPGHLPDIACGIINNRPLA